MWPPQGARALGRRVSGSGEEAFSDNNFALKF